MNHGKISPARSAAGPNGHASGASIRKPDETVSQNFPIWGMDSSTSGPRRVRPAVVAGVVMKQRNGWLPENGSITKPPFGKRRPTSLSGTARTNTALPLTS